MKSLPCEVPFRTNRVWCVLSFIFFLLLSPKVWAGPTLAGKVVSINGKASIKGVALKVGADVFEGDVIRTEVESGVKLLMRDHTVVDIAADSSFRIKEYQATSEEDRKVGLELDYGSVRAAVSKKLDQKSHFTIRTKSSVLAVRGTEFSASWRVVNGKAEEKITVAHGQVEVKPSFGEGKLISLGAGKQLTSSGNLKNDRVVASENSKEGGIRVATLSPKDADRAVASSAVEDKTFTKSVDLSNADGKGNGNPGAGAATVSSIAIATGAKEAPKARGPRSEGESGDDRRNRAEKGDKGDKGDKKEGGVASNDVPAGAGIPGGSHSPGGNVPGKTDSPPNSGPTTITAKIAVHFN